MWVTGLANYFKFFSRPRNLKRLITKKKISWLFKYFLRQQSKMEKSFADEKKNSHDQTRTILENFPLTLFVSVPCKYFNNLSQSMFMCIYQTIIILIGYFLNFQIKKLIWNYPPYWLKESVPGKVDEKATQLHAIASLKVLLDATKPQRGAATSSAANHVKINLKETTLGRPNGNIDTTLDSVWE